MKLKMSILSVLALWGCMGCLYTDAQAKTKDEFINDLIPKSTRGIKDISLIQGANEQVKPQTSMQLRFGLNSAGLRPDAVAELNNLAAALEVPLLREYKFIIEGYTCDLGSAAHNLELSKRRAFAVADFLTSHTNLSPQQFEINGYGESNPAVPNTDENSRKINRRVVIRNTLQKADVSLQGRPATLQINRYRNGQVEIVSDGDTVTSNSQYSVFFKTSTKQYVYICQKDSSSEAALLFPQPDFSSQTNPITPGATYRIPGQDGSGFTLDNTVGTEQFALLALDTPVQNPLNACATVFQGDTAVTRGIKGITSIISSEPSAAAGDRLRLCEVMQGGKTRGIQGITKIRTEASSPVNEVLNPINSCQGLFLKRFFNHE